MKYRSRMQKVKEGYAKRLSRSRRKGLILIFTGDGKGKSTAAFGMAFRAMGWGLRVAVVQFIKGTSETGEFAMARELGVEWHRMGAGFTWETQDKSIDCKAASLAWAKSVELMKTADLLVLDELNVALSLKQLAIAPVLDALSTKPSKLHVVITGRNAPRELIEIADVVSEMRLVKHAFTRGIAPQRGVEF